MDQTRSLSPSSVPAMPSAPRPGASRLRETAFLVVLGLAGAALFFSLYARNQPAARFDLRLNRARIQELADAFLIRHGVDLADYPRRNTALTAENAQLAFYQTHDLTEAERARLERHDPAASWIVHYLSDSRVDRFAVRLDAAGRVIGSTRTVSDDLAGAEVALDDAENLAQAFLEQEFGVDFTLYTPINAQSVRQTSRTDHTFSWHHIEPGPAGSRLLLTATVLGDRVDEWSFEVDIPEPLRDRYTQQANRGNLWELLAILVSILVSLGAIVVFALRFRESEVSVRNGIVVAVALVVVFSLWLIEALPYLQRSIYSTPSALTPAILYFNLSLQVFFVGVSLFFVWVSGESVTRELWPHKLKAFDGLFARYVFFPEFGVGILRGFAVGLVQLGFWYAGVALLTRHDALWLKVGEIDLFMLSSTGYFFFLVPVAMPLFLALYGALLSSGYGFLFLLSFLRRKTGRLWIAVLVSLVFFGGFFEATTLFSEHWMTVMLGTAASLVMYAAYLRYDLMTAFVGLVVYTALPGMMLYTGQPAPALHLAGLLGLGLMGVLFVYGLAAVAWGTPLDVKAVEPRYARHISERERLKLELDIARRAQLHMLPSQVPRPRGLDIAAFSEPAREVGGDYFDFFPLDENYLGVAIGDVSGKGMPAALYMTMLKGSLQSQVSLHVSPKDILSHLNRTFYKAAERNFFVTLLFGIIDIAHSTLTFARAGHHPVLLYRPTTDTVSFMCPPGIGIGLEGGPAFERIIRNETVSLVQGDTLILYTDGLTESRNADAEEFGEERLTNLVKGSANGTAEELMQRLRAGYAAFIGRVPAHDDLTCVIIKII